MLTLIDKQLISLVKIKGWSKGYLKKNHKESYNRIKNYL